LKGRCEHPHGEGARNVPTEASLCRVNGFLEHASTGKSGGKPPHSKQLWGHDLVGEYEFEFV
jgi:hypothetical protein